MKFKRFFCRETLWLGFWLTAGLVSVIGYNAWVVCCGACSIDALATFGWADWLLLSANLVAATMLGMVRRANNLKIQDDKCFCGRSLRPLWKNCPDCGKKLS